MLTVSVGSNAKVRWFRRGCSIAMAAAHARPG
jgi:hypothetical protein